MIRANALRESSGKPFWDTQRISLFLLVISWNFNDYLSNCCLVKRVNLSQIHNTILTACKKQILHLVGISCCYMEYIHILSCNRTRPQIHKFSLQWRIQGANPAMAPSAGHGGIGHCQLTSLTSFFCCDHHNNKRRLRFSTVLLWLTPTFLQTHFLLQGCGRWCMPLSSTFQLYFHGFRLL